jgi:hypothetical protein
MDGSIFKHQISYTSALKKWNDKTFGDALFAKPAIGTVAHQEVKNIQKGIQPETHVKISELTKDAKKKPSDEKSEPKKGPTTKQDDKEKGKKIKANLKESLVQRKIKKIMSADTKHIKDEMAEIRRRYGGKEPPKPEATENN